MKVVKRVIYGPTGFRYGVPDPGGIRTLNPSNAPTGAAANASRVELPKGLAGDSRIVIAIADDSSVAMADIYPGGRFEAENRFRVAVGCPYIGEIADDHIYVVPVRTFKLPAFGGVAADFLIWENTRTGTADDPNRWPPVRLNIWRGEQPGPVIQHVRAPLEAQFAGTVNAGRGVICVVCVDERRSWDVIASVGNPQGGATTMSAELYGDDSMFGPAINGPQNFSHQLILSQPAAAAFTIREENQGKPYGSLALAIYNTALAGTFDFQVRVTASDY